jgi:hypothetical protein
MRTALLDLIKLWCKAAIAVAIFLLICSALQSETESFDSCSSTHCV